MTLSYFIQRLLAVLLVIALSPLLIAVGLVIRFRLGHPVLYRQERTGLNGRPFTLLKFRSMTEALDGNGATIEDAKRLTPFGLWLRQTSLDELPQLINILRGEMAFIGPRPLLMEYLPLYTPEQNRRHLVRPGLTGWAQVNGRNSIDWNEKFKLDLWYIDNQSLLLDMRIVLLTMITVVRRKGVSSSSHVSMPPFIGK